jgi:hypothetical protein
MVSMKLFEVRTIAALSGIINSQNEPGPLPPTAPDPACNLNILSGRLWLAHDAY